MKTNGFDINTVAAQILLSGEEGKAKNMRKAAEKKVGEHLKGIISEVLNKKTSLKGDKIESICDQVIERYLEDIQ